MSRFADECTRVYTRRGNVAHLLSPASTMINGVVLCPAGPQDWGGIGWLGTGSQREYERAVLLPTCKRCARVAAAEDEYHSEPSQFTAPAEVAS